MSAEAPLSRPQRVLKAVAAQRVPSPPPSRPLVRGAAQRRRGQNRGYDEGSAHSQRAQNRLENSRFRGRFLDRQPALEEVRALRRGPAPHDGGDRPAGRETSGDVTPLAQKGQRRHTGEGGEDHQGQAAATGEAFAQQGSVGPEHEDAGQDTGSRDETSSLSPPRAANFTGCRSARNRAAQSPTPIWTGVMIAATANGRRCASPATAPSGCGWRRGQAPGRPLMAGGARRTSRGRRHSRSGSRARCRRRSGRRAA